MLKKITAIFCTVSIIASLCPLVFAEQTDNKITYYVSTDGKNNATGTKDDPFASIDEAKKQIRKDKKEQKSKFEVIIRGGEYRVKTNTDFSADDSGTAEDPIVYRAADGETPVFKASVELKNAQISEVTDANILKRIQEKVRDKIVAIDLSKDVTQDEIRNNTDITPSLDKFVGGEPNFLYVDDVKQTMSEWPNGDGAYTHWISSEDGRTTTFEGINPIYWSSAKDWWIGGYQDWDWRYSRIQGIGVDPVNKTITVSDANSNFKFTSYQSRRWKAFNLLEEIDVPGEFYIDRDNMTLYLYPPYTLKDAKLELSLKSGYFMNIKNTENVTFEGLTFTQCTDDAINMTDVNNIDFIGCKFKDLASKGIVCAGSKKAKTDAAYWQNQQLDGSYNCDIKNCVFDDIGSSALDISGGNVDTLTPSDNVIENNIFYRCSQTNKCCNAILLQGCGHKFYHNNVSRCAYQAVLYRGNDMEFMYNEMYDSIQETDDCGIIYSGRNSIMRGDVIAYNYLHDSLSTEVLSFGHQCAIYWDDQQCGQEAYNNIIKTVNKNIYTNGIDDVYKNNTSIDIKRGSMDIKNGGSAPNNTDERAAGFGSVIANPEIYYRKYTNLQTIMQMMESGNARPDLAKFNVVTGNLDVASAENIIGSNTVKYGEYKNNISLDSCEDFVDAENQDYRIRTGSATAKKMPGLLNDTFDINQIGVQYDVKLNSETSPFRQLYPENGKTAVSVNNTEFKWQDAFGASKYRLVIATDRELKNIVYDETADYSVKKADGLEKNKIYYWKVYAINQSRDFGATWESISPVFTFSTAIYEKLNTDYFNNIVNTTKKKANGIVEGKNPGDYIPGTKSTLNATISKAQTIANSRLGTFSQKQFDAMADEIGTFFATKNKVNCGVLDFGKYIEQPKLWKGDAENKDNMLTIKGDSKRTYLLSETGIDSIGQMTGSVLYSFDAKIKVDKGFIDMGLNQNIKAPQYDSSNQGYSLVIKPDVIELQRTNGTENKLLTSVPYAIDKEWHKFEYGWVDIGIGNLIMLNIDDKPIIEYQDVVNGAVTTLCNFCILVYNNTENSVSVRRTEQPMTNDEFTEQLKKNTYESAKTLLDGIRSDYNKREPFVILKKNATKVINEEKVVDLSGAPVVSQNGEYMIPVAKIADILGAEVKENDGNYTVTWKEKSAVVTKDDIVTTNEIPMISVETLLDRIDRGFVKEDNKDLLIVGNIVTMNNVEVLSHISSLIDLMETLGDNKDVSY